MSVLVVGHGYFIAKIRYVHVFVLFMIHERGIFTEQMAARVSLRDQLLRISHSDASPVRPKGGDWVGFFLEWTIASGQ